MNTELLVCCGTGCIANGSLVLLEELKRELAVQGAAVKISAITKHTGCNGFCENGPIVRIMPEDISYYRVQKEDAEEIVRALTDKGLVERLLYSGTAGEKVRTQKENPFYREQMKIALRNAGLIEPANLEDYLSRGGFEGLKKALAMKPAEIIAELETSGLRGRGGAGFPTGRKWRECAGYQDFPKYAVCNGDEGDPGAFMDRSIMEGDPLSVIEGLTIAALAIGAHEGFMYIRDEYGLAVKNVQKALKAAREKNFLGKNILGSGYDFDVSVVRGGGAFVCGESSALMASIEGKPGEPRTKYIRSAEKGLWDKPTVLNNVETLANVPYIMLHGGEHYAKIGTPSSAGTKVFALVGKVKRTGLVEVPMGTSLRKLIFDIGGGISGDRTFKAVQTGGPSGGCIPESLLDLEIDFDNLAKYGSMMGSGGMIVMDDRTCMAEVARYYISFLSEESCGKCTPCREGLRRMLQILTGICAGTGRRDDLTELESIGKTMQDAALCALGRTAPNPVLSTLRYFRDEYEAHITEKRCPAGVCPALSRFVIINESCKACGMCVKSCPAGAIRGEKKKPPVIDQTACITCGSCREACKFGAVTAEGKNA
jgi:NADH-quinone oxidoreductase subunit F